MERRCSAGGSPAWRQTVQAGRPHYKKPERFCSAGGSPAWRRAVQAGRPHYNGLERFCCDEHPITQMGDAIQRCDPDTLVQTTTFSAEVKGVKMNHSRSRFVVVLAVLTIACGAQLTFAQEIVGSLSNFDVRNTDDRPYNDFELVLFGDVDRECIRGFYPGWGAPPKVTRGTPSGSGVTITWQDRDDPIEPGRSEHFGVNLTCEGPITARGFWSIDGRRAREIPLPWQVWRVRDGVVWDIIQMPRELEAGQVRVQREWVTLPEPVALERLNWADVERLVPRSRREWQGSEPVTLGPGEHATLEIPATAGDGAVLVRYTVQSRQGIVSRFVNQAILGWVTMCPSGLPDPLIQITGSEDYETGGMAFTRYRISVTNRAEYPDSLFAAAPDLPPCGLNTNSSRTWVDIHDGDGHRIYGFCALGEADSLNDLWFALPRGTPPPDCVSVTLTDRRCAQSYTSSCAPITGLGPACINFESPALGTTYNVGDVFTDSGATMTVEPFQWSNSNWTSGGQALIDDAGMAGGTGQELGTNNVNVNVGFPVTPNVVHLRFGEYGGNLNLEVNGDFQNFGNMAEIHNTMIGGALATVTNGFGDDTGTLMLSGEINSLAVGGQELWVDNICYTEQPGVNATGTWIMPYGVGGTPLYRIKPTGLTDYSDGSRAMIDAPFGGHLGFRLGRANLIPTTQLYYYRFQYRHESDVGWADFSSTVRVHYQVESPGNPPVFPTLVLGPHNIAGKNLYRFQPHETELPSLVPPLAPGETVSWPNTGWVGDIYRGFLNTVGANLLPGRHVIRLEIYDQAGAQVMPGPPGGGAFDFVVPISQDADGTINTDFAPGASVIDDGFEFSLHIDNRPTGALIDQPMIGPIGAGNCGFLRYVATSDPVDVSFHATHPDNRAIFNFRIARGPDTVTLSPVTHAEVAAPTAGIPGSSGPYSGDGFGHFTRTFTVAELLETCPDEAAFAQVLYVYAKATRGWGHRISSLDRSHVYAFALTPETP